MLNVQIMKSRDKKLNDALQSNRARVHAIAKLHERLYQSEDYAKIDIRSHIQTLIRDLNQLYDVSNKNIEYQLEIASIELSMDLAVPCSIVINELMTNAIRHAFKGRDIRPVISILLYEENHNLKFTFKDNGRGFNDAPDFEGTHSFGLFCVKMLIENQLGGRLDFNSSDVGTVFSIEFPI